MENSNKLDLVASDKAQAGLKRPAPLCSLAKAMKNNEAANRCKLAEETGFSMVENDAKKSP